MKPLIATLGVVLAATTLAGCADDDYRYSRASLYISNRPYYDGYYGPYYDGYWGGDGYYYYRAYRGDRHYHRDEGRHFRREHHRYHDDDDDD